MMKKMIAMLLCLLLGCGAALAETALDVVYASTYPAYSACDDNGVFSGFNVDLVQALADMDGELAVGKQWIQEPYDLLALRNISMSGENSLVLPLFKTRDAEVYKDYNYGSRPYLSFPVAAVVPADSGIASIADLAGKSVAFEGNIVDGLEAYNAAHTDAPLDCVVAGEGEYIYDPVGMIEDGEADAAILSMISAAKAISSGDGNYVLVEIPDAEQLYCSKLWIAYDVSYGVAAFDGDDAAAAQIEPVRARVEADLDALVANGTYAELCQKYFGMDFTPWYVFGEDQPEAPAAEETAEAPAGEEPAEAGEEAAAEPPVVYTDRETVKKVQQALNDAGYNCGTPDGLAGKKTNQAVIDFKAANGIDDATPDITDALLAALGIG